MTRRAYAGVVGAGALLGAALIAASLIGARAGESAPGTEISGSTTSALLSGIPQSGPVLGRPDAPVTLVEFADVQCPYCAYWSHTAFAEIVRDYVRPGKVRLVFSGLAFIGPDSERGLRFRSPPATRESSGTESTFSTRTRAPRTRAGSATRF